MPDDKEWVYVATNLTAMDAEMMRVQLEVNGFEVQIVTDVVSSVRMGDLGICGSNIAVPEEQAESALKLLSEQSDSQEEASQESLPGYS